jgi:hypothetical protein
LTVIKRIKATEDQYAEQAMKDRAFFASRISQGLSEQAILAARNVDVNELNDYLLDRLPSEEHSYKSIVNVAMRMSKFTANSI